MFKQFKLFFFFILLLIILSIGFKAFIIVDAKKTGKSIYEINVNNFNQIETYITKEFTRDKETGCITFKDEFGIKHIVCNNYTITEY